MKSNVRLIVDSTFGLEKEYAIKNKIEVVSLKMLLDDEVFVEDFNETWHDFFEKMRVSKNFPKTSQPAPEDFISAIKKIYKEDKDADIIILTLSGTLSGTINAATLAVKEFENRKIVAIDSQQACLCGRLLTEEVVDLINECKTYEEILEILPRIQKALKIQFMPENLEALKKGGRIGLVGAAIASILKIKPIFQFNDGTLTVTKKVIGIQKAITEAIVSLPQNLKKLYVCYIHDNALVEHIKQKLETMIGLKNPKVLPVGPVFGVHVGIGAVGLASLENY